MTCKTFNHKISLFMSFVLLVEQPLWAISNIHSGEKLSSSQNSEIQNTTLNSLVDRLALSNRSEKGMTWKEFYNRNSDIFEGALKSDLESYAKSHPEEEFPKIDAQILKGKNGKENLHLSFFVKDGPRIKRMTMVLKSIDPFQLDIISTVDGKYTVIPVEEKDLQDGGSSWIQLISNYDGKIKADLNKIQRKIASVNLNATTRTSDKSIFSKNIHLLSADELLQLSQADFIRYMNQYYLLLGDLEAVQNAFYFGSQKMNPETSDTHYQNESDKIQSKIQSKMNQGKMNQDPPVREQESLEDGKEPPHSNGKWTSEFTNKWGLWLTFIEQFGLLQTAWCAEASTDSKKTELDCIIAGHISKISNGSCDSMILL